MTIRTTPLVRSIELIHSVEALVRIKRSFCRQNLTLLSISGGQDSTCLTAVMVQLQFLWGGRMGVVSCNHLWQEDSFYSLFHVARMCFLLNQSFSFVTASRKCTLGNEGEARIWRHNSIHRIASFYGYPVICTGHTGSDRVETTLFNLIRGSGKRGLSSLYWSRFLLTAFPKLYHLSTFDRTATAQKDRFVCSEVVARSKERGANFRQIWGLCAL